MGTLSLTLCSLSAEGDFTPGETKASEIAMLKTDEPITEARTVVTMFGTEQRSHSR
jgi:hypothetical protein